MAKAMRSDHQWLGKLIRLQSRELICTHYPDGRFSYISPSVKSLLKYQPYELRDKSPVEFLHPDDQELFYSLPEKSALPGQALEWRFNTGDGHYIWLQTLLESFKDEESGEWMIFSTSRDVTRVKEQVSRQIQDLEQMSASLGRQNQQLLEFSYIISHNLRGPVGNMVTLANFLQESETREEQEMVIGKIHESSNVLNNTFEELMEVLKVRNQSDIQLEEVRIRELMVETCQMFEASVRKYKGTIEVDIEPDIKVKAFPIYLKSIAVNLLSNSIKYRDPDKDGLEILIKFHINSKGEHCLSFSDNGLGIDMNRHKEKIFRLHKTFHRHPDARGFGLFMSKNQMEVMGGEIRLTSKVGEGSTFTLVFNPVNKTVNFKMPELF